jgi:hypothetical protein
MDELLSAVKETGGRRPASPRTCLIIGQLGLGGTEKLVAQHVALYDRMWERS